MLYLSPEGRENEEKRPKKNFWVHFIPPKVKENLIASKVVRGEH